MGIRSTPRWRAINRFQYNYKLRPLFSSLVGLVAAFVFFQISFPLLDGGTMWLESWFSIRLIDSNILNLYFTLGCTTKQTTCLNTFRFRSDRPGSETFLKKQICLWFVRTFVLSDQKFMPPSPFFSRNIMFPWRLFIKIMMIRHARIGKINQKPVSQNDPFRQMHHLLWFLT